MESRGWSPGDRVPLLVVRLVSSPTLLLPVASHIAIASYDERYTSGKPTQLSRSDLLAHHVMCLSIRVEHEVNGIV